ncbi:MAG: radical SAM family heme chaperone HemW [Treponema sp.]|nr:radical SAM family heme chaperone HemW [Treponema sp.]
MKEIPLYVHIPFCAKKCGYCDFFSIPQKSISDDYVRALVKEISFFASEYKLYFKTVYVGGGTPSLLSESQIEFLFRNIKPFFSQKIKEVTFEMNPESVTGEKLKVLEASGVNRISVGIQSLTQNALDFCGRKCSALTAENALKIISRVWKNKFSADAISGLPCQSDKEFLDSLKKIISYNPDHVSLYSLSLEEGTPLYKKFENGSYDYDGADEQWIFGRDFLFKNGYFQYEVSNFSKPGFEGIHNSCYWAQEDYAGCGCGATGTFYKERLRWTDTRNIEKYIKFWLSYDGKGRINTGEIPRETEILSIKDIEYEFLMMGLRTLKGLDSKVYEKKFGKSLKERLEQSSVWNDFVREKKASVSEGCFSLNKDGILFLNKLLLSL